MTEAGHYAFNLFFNSACSFIAGLAVVWLTIRIFRIEQNRWKLFLLCLPFIKIIWDLSYRRIPSSSIALTGINPLTLPPKNQALTIGAGFSKFGPIFNLVFTANYPGGKQYSESLVDYLFAFISKYMNQKVPFALLIGAILLSLFCVGRRVISTVQFEKRRRKWRPSDRLLEIRSLGFRQVDIYVSPHYEGTPFTGGIFKPYICIPQKAFELLSNEERAAVIQHELGHIRQWDLVGTLFIKCLGDLFWFIPGYRYLSTKIDRLREILADDSALRAGAAPERLASALVTLQNAGNGNSDAALYSAFFRERNLLKLRVERLIGKAREARSRLGWRHLWVRILVTAWTTGAVMLATFGGNHEVSVRTISHWLDLLPFGIGGLLRAWGFN